MALHVSSTDIEPPQTCASEAFPTLSFYHQLNSCTLHNCTLKHKQSAHQDRAKCIDFLYFCFIWRWQCYKL